MEVCWSSPYEEVNEKEEAREEEVEKVVVEEDVDVDDVDELMETNSGTLNNASHEGEVHSRMHFAAQKRRKKALV